MSQGMERYAKEGLLLGAVVVNGLQELGDSSDFLLRVFSVFGVRQS